MPRRGPTYRKVWTIAGMAAAVAFAVRGLLDWRSGGWVLLLVAVATLAAIALRHTRYRD